MNQLPSFETPLELELEPERYELYAEPRYQFALDRRDFCALLGGGILICLLAEETSGQQPGRGRGRGFSGPQELGPGCTSPKMDK
jgi:hypothetical protein